jgi:hypothetical protein
MVDYKSLYEEIDRSVRVSGDDYAIGDDNYEHTICGCRYKCKHSYLHFEDFSLVFT